MADWQQTVDLVCEAPAKINLFLHIVGRRSDGYHELQTAFQLLDFHDTLGFSRREDGRIVLHTPLPGVADVDNIIVKAAKLLQQSSNGRYGADIYLHKRIPMGGGLGGGSSNAATTLVALNQLWQADLSKEHLLDMGLQLGADVPVFIFGQAAWAEGVGEQLKAISPPAAWYVVLFPHCLVPTPKIFNDSELTRDTSTSKMCDLMQLAPDGRSYMYFGHNDCEPVARKHYTEIDDALTALAQYADVRMSGTGASVFAAFPLQAEAERVLAQVQDVCTGVVVKSINKSPLVT